MEISSSRTEAARRVERARMLLEFAEGISVSEISRDLRTNRPKVERTLDKAAAMGALAALSDLAGRGRPATITDDAKAWILSLACQKPKDLGYSFELWTGKLLASHLRAHCNANGHPCLARIARGTVSTILSRAEVRPHKIKYYLEKRDPDFKEKMAEVLHVYREVELLRREGQTGEVFTATLSFDEKPGIQAIENTAPDLPPVPGKYSSIARDHEYIRHGTVSLMAGIDLVTGEVSGIVVDRHRSREFISFLKLLHGKYPKKARIRIVLDNHSAHTSKETREFLSTLPNRFEFIFTPKHGSWLNLVESFFSKMARTMLRGIRVGSKQELKERILLYLDEVNRDPVVFRWKSQVDDSSVASCH